LKKFGIFLFMTAMIISVKPARRFVMKRTLLLFVLFAALGLVFSPPALAQGYDLKMMTGPMGGSWYPLGGAIADAVQKDVPGATRWNQHLLIPFSS
jgi:hypothetical protein